MAVAANQKSSGNVNSGLRLWDALRQFPSQIKYIVGNEASERFSFYGMRSILVVYMIQYLAMEKAEATATFHYFVSACYFMPLLGAFMSDRFLGKYRTILYVSLLYCVGHGVLSGWENKEGLFAGLFLIALGSGGIKPCVSAHVGDQFSEKNKHLVRYVFDLFYWSVNFGSFFSTLLIPYVLKHYGPSWAFGIPGVLMVLATYVFWMGRKEYVHIPPAKNSQFLGALFSPSEQGVILRRIAGVFAMVSVFWALFDQHSSSWVLQAKRMDLNVFGLNLEASQIAALNPIMVMVLIPLFSSLIYPWLEKRGIPMKPLQRMTWGMILTALSFVLVGFFEWKLDQGVQVSVLWQVIPFLILTAGEVMVSITGLEFAYTQAPVELKSTVMSLWHLTVFFGNFITAFVAQVNVFNGPAFFWFFAALMVVFSGFFSLIASRYQGRDRMQTAQG